MTGVGRSLLRVTSAEAIALAVALLVLAQDLVNHLTGPSAGPASNAVAVLGTVGLTVTTTLTVLRPLRAAVRRQTALVLTGQLVLTVVPFALLGASWGGAVGITIACCLILLRRRVAVGLSCAGVLATAARLGPDSGTLEGLYFALGTVLTAMTVWGLTILAETTAALVASREEVARLAVAAERDRVSRDLEQLLGAPLVDLAVRSDAAADAIDADPVGAQHAVASLVLDSRARLDDVRAIARGRRGLSVAAQLSAARSLLASAGIGFDVSVDDSPVPASIDSLLAEVIRQGVTATLRRGSATRCALTLGLRDGAARIELADDGTGRGGDDLGTLSHEISGAGGTLRSGPDGCGGHLLHAAVPVR